VLSVLSGPVILCSLVILCPPGAGTGCSPIAVMRHQITSETDQLRPSNIGDSDIELTIFEA